MDSRGLIDKGLQTGLNTSNVVVLEYFQCIATEFPDSGIDCSQRDFTICVKCEIRGAYLTDPNISLGELICQILLLISVILGVVGVFTNLIISCVLYKRKTKRAIDFLLLIYALTDFFSCFSTIFGCVTLILYLGKVFGTTKQFLYWVYFLSLILQICRSSSFHVTVLITLERYLVIAYPLRSRTWFSRKRSKIQVLFIFVYVLLLCVPRYTSLYIGENIYSDKEGGLNVPSLAKFEYVFRPTKWHIFWLDALGEFFEFYLFLADFWISNLCLLVFNLWSLKKVRRINIQRLQLNSTQQKEIQVARMFIPVVVVVLVCSLWMIVTFVSTYLTNIFYREVWTALLLVNQVHSVANLFIFYFRSKEFAMEINLLLSDWYSSMKTQSASSLS